MGRENFSTQVSTNPWRGVAKKTNSKTSQTFFRIFFLHSWKDMWFLFNLAPGPPTHSPKALKYQACHGWSTSSMCSVIHFGLPNASHCLCSSSLLRKFGCGVVVCFGPNADERKSICAAGSTSSRSYKFALLNFLSRNFRDHCGETRSMHTHHILNFLFFLWMGHEHRLTWWPREQGVLFPRSKPIATVFENPLT